MKRKKKKKNQYTESLFHLPKISICQWQYAKLTKGTDFPKIIFLWFLYTLWTPLKQFPFIFLMGGEKEGSFTEKGPYHHHLQQPKVTSAWLWPWLRNLSWLSAPPDREVELHHFSPACVHSCPLRVTTCMGLIPALHRPEPVAAPPRSEVAQAMGKLRLTSSHPWHNSPFPTGQRDTDLLPLSSGLSFLVCISVFIYITYYIFLLYTLA